MCEHDQRTDQCSIALIGIGCRFPGGVTDPDEYWKLLVSGTNAVTEIPDGRWDVQRYYHPDPAQPGKYSCPKGAFLSQVDQFDASFLVLPLLRLPAWTPSSVCY
jgi:phthiocerol/phenolphthiocerol synthesis type-I polyketide synthase D